MLTFGAGTLLLASGNASAAPARSTTAVNATTLSTPSASPAALVTKNDPPSCEEGTSDTACAGQPWRDAWTADGLPAWKWREIDLDIDTSGWFGTGKIKEIPVIIAEIIFNIANFAWSILLAILKFGFEADGMLVLGAGAINAGAAFIGGRLLYIAPLFLVVGIWQIARSFLGGRNKPGGVVPAFRTTFIFVVMFGALAGVTTRSTVAHNTYPNDPQSQLTVSGTLPWAASEILDMADKLTNPLTGPVIGEPGKKLDGNKDAVAVITGAVEDQTDTGDTEPISCAKYVAAMESAYIDAPNAERTLVVVSRLWESTFLESWKFATLGGPVTHRRADSGQRTKTDIPSRMMCHWAEAVNGADPAQQQSIAKAAYGAAIPAVTQNGMPIFGPFDATSSKERRKAMTAWGACTYRNGWTGHKDFDGAWQESGMTNEYTNNGWCKEIFTDGSDLEDKKLNIFGGDVGDAAKKGDAAQLEQTKAVRAYGIALSGANPGARILHSAVSLAVAILFIWSLGFIGLGLVAAMLMAIICLVLAIPVGFAMAAAGKTAKATPLFRITLTSLLAESFFTLVLSAIVILSGLFQRLIGGIGGLPPTLLSLMNGAAPVAAFLLVRKLMKSLGMADIFTATGALSFAASAAAATSGKGSWAKMGKAGEGGKSDIGKMMQKTPWLGKKLNKADRFAPQAKNWKKAGRAQRSELAEKEREAKRERLEKKIADRGDKGAFKRMRNAVDAARLPSDVKDRLKNLAGGLGMVGVIGMATGPVGLGALGLAQAGRAAKKQWKKGRLEEVDEDAAEDVPYEAGEVHGGRDAAPRRAESLADVNSYISDTTDRVYADMKTTDPGSNPAERIQRGLYTAIEDMMGAYAESLTGSRDLLTDTQVDGLRISTARALGYGPNGIVATAGGVAIPVPYSPERARGELTPDQLKSFVHWLPEHDRERQTVTDINPLSGTAIARPENAQEYAARLFATGIARGVLHPDGSSIDVLSLHGLDMRDPSVQARVESWKSGNPDPVLDTLRIGAIDDALEARLVAASREVARAQATMAGSVFAPVVPLAIAPVVSTPTTTTTTTSTSTPTPPAPPATADAGLTAQLLLAVNASRELLEETRRTGGDVSSVAAKVTETMTRLEGSQEELVNQISNVLTENFEKQLILQAGRDQDFANRFEAIFTNGVDDIAETVEEVRATLDAFRNGLAPMNETVANLTRIVDTANKANAENAKKVADAMREYGTVLGQWGDTMRRGGTYAVPSAKQVVEGTGAPSMPNEEK